MLGRKGQEEAPFSLFLAAVMLALLIPIVATLYNDFEEQRSLEMAKNNMENLARQIEIATSMSGSGTPVYVDLDEFSYGDVQVERFVIYNFGEKECIRNCQVGTCRMLVAVGTTEEGQPQAVGGLSVCIRLPPELTLKNNGCPEGYHDLLPFNKEGLEESLSFEPHGYNLVFIRNNEATENQFMICCVGDVPQECDQE